MRLQPPERRNIKAAVFAFLFQDIEQDGGPRPRFGVAVEIDHIVEVARTRAVAEGTHLFSECLLIGVAQDGDPLRRRIAVIVEDGALDRRQDEKLIGRQIELDARETAGAGSDRPPVAQLSLTGHRAAGVLEDVEFLQLFRKLYAGLFVDPFSDVAEYARQEVAVDLRWDR